MLKASLSGEVIVGGTLAVLGRPVALGTPAMPGESAVLGTSSSPCSAGCVVKNGTFKADGIVCSTFCSLVSWGATLLLNFDNISEANVINL